MSRLIGLIGQGVGVAVEYNQHRKQQKLSRENSRQEEVEEPVAGPSSSRPQQASRGISNSSSAPQSPPAYEDVTGDRSIPRGAPASDDKKAGMAQYADDDEESLEDDEEDWELDEALEPSISPEDGPPSYEQSEAEFYNTDELVREVMQTSRSAAPISTNPPTPRQPLPCPVILPQRRPRKKARGFVRAYAPVLADSGISQQTFLSFLENFDRSSQASPIFGVIQISAGIAGFAPSVIAQVVTTVAQIGAQVGAELQSRQRTNTFLDRMNEELFKPAGLYAFIMKYKPDADLGAPSSRTDIGARFGLRPEVVDMSTNQIIAKYHHPDEEGSSRSMSDRMRDMRLASGTTQGSFALPEAAPLIFPAIDDAVATRGADETFKDKAKDAKNFLADYMDRRAQMQYAAQDPLSSLAVPEEQRAFKSRFADPNHAMYNNGLVGLVSGGAVTRTEGRERRRSKEARRDARDERRIARYERRMEEGRDLSRHKQRRYDEFWAERESGGDYTDDGGRRGFRDDDDGRRRSRGGPVHRLVGAAATAMANRGGEPGAVANDAPPPAPYGGSAGSGEYGDQYGDRYGDQYTSEEKREYGQPSDQRSASYGYEDNSAYGGSRPANPPAPVSYGGRRGGRRRKGEKNGPVGRVKRLLREDVLYLMIVNMPSEAELAEAREALGVQKGRS